MSISEEVIGSMYIFRFFEEEKLHKITGFFSTLRDVTLQDTKLPKFLSLAFQL